MYPAMQALSAFLYTQSESTPQAVFLSVMEQLLSTGAKPAAVLQTQSTPALPQLPPILRLLGELCIIPHRGIASASANVLLAVMRHIDANTRQQVQLQARDDGLLLHQLWSVATQASTSFPIRDARSTAFALLDALVAGNAGCVCICVFCSYALLLSTCIVDTTVLPVQHLLFHTV